MTSKLIQSLQKIVGWKPERILDNRERFRKMLETYVPQVGYSAPINPRILDIGCGRCSEYHVLRGYFGNKPFGADSKEVLFVGVDIDGEAIETARKNYPQSNCRFIYGDATRLRNLVDGRFDIVVVQHPNIEQISEIWYTILTASKSLIKPQGLFLGTTFRDIEHRILEKQVQEIGYNIALSTSNEYATRFSAKDASLNKNVVLARG